MSGKLVVVVTMEPKPNPDRPGDAFVQLRITPQWIIGKIPQACTDHAMVISALKQALDYAIESVPYSPPTVLTPPLALVEGAH